MIDRPPASRLQIIAGILRELTIGILAFVAGIGVAIAAYPDRALTERDYWALAGAGATAVLLRLFPGTSGRGQGRG